MSPFLKRGMRGIRKMSPLPYNKNLKMFSRELRNQGIGEGKQPHADDNDKILTAEVRHTDIEKQIITTDTEYPQQK